MEIVETAQLLDKDPREWLLGALQEKVRSEFEHTRRGLHRLRQDDVQKYERKLAEYGWTNFDPLKTDEWEQWLEAYLGKLGLIPGAKTKELGIPVAIRLLADEKEILYSYRTLSFETQKLAKKFILNLEPYMSDEQLWDSYLLVCPQIVSEIHYAAPDLGIFLEKRFPDCLKRMLDELIGIKILVPPDSMGFQKFYETFESYIKNDQLEVGITETVDIWQSSLSPGGFELWFLKKGFFARLDLGDKDLETIGYFWHWLLAKQETEQGSTWARGEKSRIVRMSIRHVNERSKWFNVGFRKASRTPLLDIL